MQRKLAVALGLTGLGIAIASLLRRRRPAAPAHGPDPRAEGLRRRIAEHRADPHEVDPPTAANAQAAEETVADARRRIHEEGRAAVDDMRRSGGDEAA